MSASTEQNSSHHYWVFWSSIICMVSELSVWYQSYQSW